MALTTGSEIPINPNVERWGIGISWDQGSTQVDLDLQAIIVDSDGSIIDAVYYNNMKALKSVVTHSGDETTGEREGMDEFIFIKMNKLPACVQLVVFIAAVYNRGDLSNVHNGMVHILEEKLDNELAHWPIPPSDCKVKAIAMLIKGSAGVWNMRVTNEVSRDGCHFMDVVEPLLGRLIRSVIPAAPKRQKVAFAMDKGDVVDMPAQEQRISARLGWDAEKVDGKDVDLDVSVMFFSKDGRERGAVFFGNAEQFGVKHGCDNLTGDGDGDDEVIDVNLSAIDEDIEQLFFTVNAYTMGVTFEGVRNAYCRVCDADGHEMARYVLTEGRGASGLIIARLFREPGAARWGFQAIGSFCRGRTWKDSIADVRPLVAQSARDLQLRPSGVAVAPAAGESSTASIVRHAPKTNLQPDECPVDEGTSPVGAARADCAEKPCCTVQCNVQ